MICFRNFYETVELFLALDVLQPYRTPQHRRYNKFVIPSVTAETRTVQRGRNDHILCRNCLYMAKVVHVYVPVQQFYVNGSRMIERVGQLFLQLITVV